MRRRTTTALGTVLSLAVIASGAGAGAGAAFATVDGPTPAALTVTTNPSIAAPVVESAATDALTLSWPSPAPGTLAALHGGVATDTHLLLYPADAILPGDADAAADATAPSPLAELDPTPGAPAAADGSAAPNTSPFTIAAANLERPLSSGETAVVIGGLDASTSYRVVTRFLGSGASSDASDASAAAPAPAAVDSLGTSETSTLADPEHPAEPVPSAEPSPTAPAPAEAQPTPSATADPAAPVDSSSHRSAAAAAASAPGVPDAPNATPLSDSAITVSWPAVSSGAPVRFYVIDVYLGETRVKTIPNLDPLLVGTTYDVTGLAAHTAYTFTVTAQGAEASSAPSARSEAVSTLRGAPGAPSKPLVTASTTDPLGLDVSWTAPASDGGYDLTGYRLELFAGTTVNLSNLVATAEVTADATRYAFGRIGLVGSSLSVRVTALNGAGEASSPLSASIRVEATAVPSTRVGQPTLTELGAGRFAVEWTAATGATASTGYLATIATTEGLSSSAVVGVVDLGTGFGRSGSSTATLPDQPGGRAYTVQITAYERIDEQTKRYRVSSLKSAPVQASGASAPQRADRPTTLTSDGADRITVAGAGIANSRANGSPVTAFELTLYRAGSSTAVGKTQVPAIAGPDDPDRMLQTAYTFTGLDRSTTYTVTAGAVNAVGTGPASASSVAVTTLAKAVPGSVPPAITTLAALRAAMSDGSVRTVTAKDAGIAKAVEPTSTLSATFPWKGTDTSGEVWLYEPLAYLGQFTVKDGVLSTSVRIGEVPDGDYALSFVPDGQPANRGAASRAGDRAAADRIAAVPITVAANRSGPTTIDNAVLRWGFSHEAGNGAFFGGCNFLTAGRIPDIGHGEVLTPDRYSAQSGPVSIEKPGASGAYELARYETRCTDRNGKPVDSNVNSPFTDAQLVIVGGAGTVDPSTNSGTIQWKGDFSVAFYGGLTFWYGSDPKLTVENGVGTLTATASGYGTDMNDLSKWVPIPPREITLGTLHGVTMRSDGFTVSPDYVGVKISQGEQVGRDGTNSSYWGSFPQSFVDFQQLTGQFSYWFTSGGRQDPGKVASPLTVGFDAATFVAVPPAQNGEGNTPSLVPNAKKPPRSLKAPAPLPPPEAAAGVGGTIYETVTVVQEGQAIPASQVVPLFLALLVLLGGVTVVAAAGGGLIASGLIPMGRR